MADIEALKDDIVAGVYEGHETDIVDAIRQRVQAGSIKIAWRIKIGDLDITEDNLTVGEAKQVEQQLGDSVFNLAPARSAENLSAYVLAAKMRREDKSKADAQAEIDAIPLKQLVQAVSDYTVTSPEDGEGD